MKKLFIFLAALLMFSGVHGQRTTTSLRLRLSDGTRLTVAVNGRYFSETGHSLTIGDLPGRNIHIKIYRFRPYANGRGGKAELVYSGRLKLDKGKAYDAVVDVDRHHLLLKEINPDQRYVEKPEFPIGRDQAVLEDAPTAVVKHPTQQSEEPIPAPELRTLKKKMDQEIADSKKLSIAIDAITNPLTAAEAARIASWFFFDATKIKFLKTIYPLITDKAHLSSIDKIFTEDNSTQTFRRFLENQK